MILILKEIPAGGLCFDEVLDLADAGSDRGEFLVAGKARLTGRAAPRDAGCDLSGRLESEVRLECSRCLEPFVYPVVADFFLRVVVDLPDPSGAEIELVAADASLFHAPGGAADLRDVALEQLYLGLPLKPVCGGDCAGLCPSCGANRNRIQCGCRAKDLDPCLAPHIDLRKQVEGI